MTLRERNMKIHWRVLSIGVVVFGAAMAYRSASYSEGLRHGWDMLIFIVIGVAFAMYAGIRRWRSISGSRSTGTRR